MKIHITGASAAGSTTLGLELAAVLSCPYFDTDDYFWLPSDQPYTLRRDPELRNEMLLQDLNKQETCVLGGSVMKWGGAAEALFDLVVFLYIPAEVRLERLKSRELSRYGVQIFTHPERIRLYNEFLNWASAYDDPKTRNSRSLYSHRLWLNSLPCEVLEIQGDTTVPERLQLIQEKLNQFSG